MKLAFAAAFLALSTVAACSPAPACETPDPAAEMSRLEIRSRAKRHKFTVEVVRTPEAQARGMMFRESLAPKCGMIFPFSPARPASFWMKNTLIPLDMIFIRANGSIARIVTATPHNLISEESGEPVAAVLEIAGGEAARLGIAEDDKVIFKDRNG